MPNQEKKGALPGTTSTPLVVVIEKSESRAKQQYRSAELREGPMEIPHKKSRAPAVPSLLEQLKEAPESSNGGKTCDNKERKDLDHAKEERSFANKLSSSNMRYEASEDINLETIPLGQIKSEKERDIVVVTTKSRDLAKKPVCSHTTVDEKNADQKSEDDSIKDEITELRMPESDNKPLEWSDDEEAGGLPRSDSRASRLSRTVRQLFCCGVPYQTASEDNKKQQSSFFALEKKASIGPCRRPGTPFERPSGITICLPKRSSRVANVPSGINFNIPKRPTSQSTVNIEMQERRSSENRNS